VKSEQVDEETIVGDLCGEAVSSNFRVSVELRICLHFLNNFFKGFDKFLPLESNTHGHRTVHSCWVLDRAERETMLFQKWNYCHRVDTVWLSITNDRDYAAIVIT